MTNIPTIACTPSAIPEDLRAWPQWVCWKLELTDADPKNPAKEQKLTKIPYSAKTGDKASSTDAATWSTFETAVAAFQRGGYSGIGFVFSKDDPFVGFDIDACISENGEIAPLALAYVSMLDTYTEKSQSGRGLKLIAKGKKPGAACKKKAPPDSQIKEFECYDEGRFFALTGCRLEGTPPTIEERAGETIGVYKAWFPEVAKPIQTSAPRRAGGDILDESGILDKARNGRNSGPKFCALFDRGDLSAYVGDHSSADLALCGMLAFWCGPNGERQVDSLFRQSALMRDKWERDDYRARTIAKAYEGRAEFYDPERHTDFCDSDVSFLPAFPDDPDSPRVFEKQVDSLLETSRQNVPPAEHLTALKNDFATVEEWEKFGRRLARWKRTFDEQFRWSAAAWYACVQVPYGQKRAYASKLFGEAIERQIRTHYAPTYQAWNGERVPDAPMWLQEELNGQKPEERQRWLQQYRDRAEASRSDKAATGLTRQELRDALGTNPKPLPPKGWAIPKAAGVGVDVAELLGEIAAVAGGTETTLAVKSLLKGLLEQVRERKPKANYADADDGIRWTDEELTAEAAHQVENYGRQEALNAKEEPQQAQTILPDEESEFLPDLPEEEPESDQTADSTLACISHNGFLLESLAPALLDASSEEEEPPDERPRCAAPGCTSGRLVLYPSEAPIYCIDHRYLLREEAIPAGAG